MPIGREKRLELCIASTWDGEAIPSAEQVAIELCDAGDDLLLTIDAPFHDDPRPTGPVGSRDRLWEHEVVELFVAGRSDRLGRPRYTEVELSPHGHYLVMRLLGVRQVLAAGLPLEFKARVAGGRWRGEAKLWKCLLPPGPHTVNAYAIHGLGESRRHLALVPVPGERPDFHKLERFQPLVLPGWSDMRVYRNPAP